MLHPARRREAGGPFDARFKDFEARVFAGPARHLRVARVRGSEAGAPQAARVQR
jgi:hypothetical protein